MKCFARAVIWVARHIFTTKETRFSRSPKGKVSRVLQPSTHMVTTTHCSVWVIGLHVTSDTGPVLLSEATLSPSKGFRPWVYGIAETQTTRTDVAILQWLSPRVDALCLKAISPAPTAFHEAFLFADVLSAGLHAFITVDALGFLGFRRRLRPAPCVVPRGSTRNNKQRQNKVSHWDPHMASQVPARRAGMAVQPGLLPALSQIYWQFQPC